MDEKVVDLTLHGCDDSTTITISVSDVQMEFLGRLEAMFAAASSYGCMPTLGISEVKKS